MDKQKTGRARGRPRREEIGNIDELLMAAAIRMVAQHGPGLTMNMIIADSGMSSKTVYARYPNKIAMISSVVRHMIEQNMHPCEIVATPDWRTGLRRFIHSTLREVSLPETLMLRHIVLLEPASLEALRADVDDVVACRYTNPLVLFFEERAVAGELPPQDFHFAARALVELLLLEGQRRTIGTGVDAAVDERELDRLAGEYAKFVCHGVGCDCSED